MFFSKFIFFFVLFFFSICSFSCDVETWTVEGMRQEFCADETLKATVSKSCFDMNCGARDLVKKARGLELTTEESSQNPGSKFCKKLNGKIVVGRNDRGSEIMFCQSADQTLVDLTSLTSSLNPLHLQSR